MQNPRNSNHFRFASNDSYFYTNKSYVYEIAFMLGEQLYKSSCDYATGSSGVALQLHYYKNFNSMNNPNFLLDEVF